MDTFPQPDPLLTGEGTLKLHTCLSHNALFIRMLNDFHFSHEISLQIELLFAGAEVEECAVVGVVDENGLTKPHAFVVVSGPSAGEELTLRLRSYLPEEKVSYDQFQAAHGSGKCSCSS